MVRANATSIEWTICVLLRSHFIVYREFCHVDLATLLPYSG